MPIGIDTNSIQMKYADDYLYFSHNFDSFGIYQFGEKKYECSLKELFESEIATYMFSDGKFVFVKGGESCDL